MDARTTAIFNSSGGIAMNQTISAPNAPAAVGPYCHAKLAGNTLYTSGQLGLIPATGELPQGVEAQARQALTNLGAVLQAGGMGFADVVKTTVFLADMGDFAAINAIYAEFFTGEAPARSCVQAGALPKGALFEIEAVAVK
jgi:2-iminobutanoate/2-iminopropanoate deaminase